jgi:hypothetical protein
MENKQPLPVRALLAALGFNPDTHRGYRRLRPFAGFQVVTLDGERIRFYTHKQLVKLQRDEWFTGEITRELEREISNAQNLGGTASGLAGEQTPRDPDVLDGTSSPKERDKAAHEPVEAQENVTEVTP